MTIDVKFNDSGREPKEKPDSKFPNGRDINLAPHALAKVCCRNLPYPAPRCGTYSIRCRECNFTVLVTVAGRADDPRTITLPCKEIRH